MTKQFWAAIVVVVLVLIGVFTFTNSHKAGAPSSGDVKATQHITGQGTKGVTLVEYGDYQCPFCEQYYATVKQVEQMYDSDIHFQFRNFPLVSLHQNAFAAARAAEAAALQNKFWEMHDALYDPINWQSWTRSNSPANFFNQIAQQLGLNVTQFKQDFASDRVNKLINADLAEGHHLDVTGTPSFFIDGKKVEISNDVAAFKKVIDAEIAKKNPSSQ
ncbi:MAG TPA: thioredoxin domain-containing protein [Candidatus Saccharimonadales bacterium]|nr:thioredoxin domain-containing protein [Candidatus Saccharimonadales bacterium]